MARPLVAQLRFARSELIRCSGDTTFSIVAPVGQCILCTVGTQMSTVHVAVLIPRPQ